MLAGSWELHLVLICAVLEEEVCRFDVAVDDGPGQRSVDDVLRCRRYPLEIHPCLCAVAGKVIVEIAQRGCTGLVEPLLFPRREYVSFIRESQKVTGILNGIKG